MRLTVNKIVVPPMNFFREAAKALPSSPIRASIRPMDQPLSRSRLSLGPSSWLLLSLWTWAIWSCAEYWRGNPNYSYGWLVPLLALVFFLRRAATVVDRVERDVSQPALGWAICAGLATAAAVFVLEFSRTQVWHFVVVIWLIAILPIAATLGLLRRQRSPLLAAALFPLLFFLTAVPWPPRIEVPVTASLIQMVAAVTTEILHWLGIEAEAVGGAIAMRTGMVGITEACSGIRSLQSGIMFGLAMGEWFLLRPLRRIWLLAIAIGLAVITNLARTLILSLLAERDGTAAVERFHDLTGNLVVTLMVVGIWLGGRLLREGPAIPFEFSFSALRPFLNVRSLRTFASVVLVAGIIGLVAARIATARIDAHDRTQTAPFFSLRTDAQVQNVPLPRDVLQELNPTSGEFFRTKTGSADCFHFFWKPSPWNRFVLVHRPDVCMPGVGWEQVGTPEPVTVPFGDRRVRFYAFRFRRLQTQALEIWGVWRNGNAVSIGYRPEQVLTDGTVPDDLQLRGKRRSATEIVACSLMSTDGTPPDLEKAVAILASVFQYQPTR